MALLAAGGVPAAAAAADDANLGVPPLLLLVLLSLILPALLPLLLPADAELEPNSRCVRAGRASNTPASARWSFGALQR
jgi:hypothetical protein